MARYIDADALIFEEKLLKDHKILGMNGTMVFGRTDSKTLQMFASAFKQMIDKAPTADVVPRSEVEKAKQEVAMEIFEVINDIVESWKVVEYSKETGDVIRTSYNGTMIAKCLAELKKKYIGEKK